MCVCMSECVCVAGSETDLPCVKWLLLDTPPDYDIIIAVQTWRGEGLLLKSRWPHTHTHTQTHIYCIHYTTAFGVTLSFSAATDFIFYFLRFVLRGQSADLQ